MAKEEKRQEDGHGVYETDGKYHCKECHHEVPIKQACPVCKKEIDWDRVFLEIRH
ncbi:MAG: endonuclease Q family protein [Dehalococcoidales bacterium]|nr:endonuclease Q family protein [Dehalococcoidales bacterium]